MSDTPLHNPHDKFFKETLGRTTTAAEFFRAYLPPEVASRLDWSPTGEPNEGALEEITLTKAQRHKG